VLVGNNLMTLGALQAIHEDCLVIPQDMAIIGFDDMPWAASLQPPLTVIAQPTFEMGVTAARLLLDRIANLDLPTRNVILDTRLIVRASSCPKRDAETRF
jgi:DNA-binding LacI/PurR family transcriptional regulator